VANIISDELRVVHLTPSRDWKVADGFLGCKVKHESFDVAKDTIYRVLKVKSGSPGE
jgi:GRASP55/65 PDZ-like domain